ncbi:acyltransferase family protein [Arthrobacter agilis]|uniref:acyltransferase family protein n=1 Tax=Arthrobacter agilis TaxID=37921 RepID=UPI002782C337|nr:acyltransferase family protein [Arthrobacter agilis]MDQ0734375.1 peptidoglycan/LPS O-acetylase OafA/YrhL [Arthrobacter agilis]
MTTSDTSAPPVVLTRAGGAQTPAAPPKTPRKDIQALRALAVTFVVLNHAAPDLLPGGYVGVDVFFVISGYLITKHLMGELSATGRLRLGSFYARRAARLLPAAMVVSVVSLVVAWLALPYTRWTGIAQETIAANVYVENWVLALKAVDYSAQTESASPLQHYWSLSVEEQFYLVWPVLLAVVFTLAVRHRMRSRALLTLVLGAVLVLSLAFCIYITYTSRSAAYFVTPARAWEFAAGALIAVRAMRHKRSRATALTPAFAGTAQATGYALILYSAVTFTERTLFPGYLALVPVVGTLLVIAAGPHHPSWSPNRLLAARPVQFIGDISYSLYLWHWPALLLVPAVLGRDLLPMDTAVLLAGAILLAFGSKRLIEDPARTGLLRRFGPRRSGMLLLGLMLTILLSATVMTVSAQAAGDRQRQALEAVSGGPCFGARSLSNAVCTDPFGPPELAQVGAEEAPWFDGEECAESQDPIVVSGGARLSTCEFTSDGQPSAEVWLVGDSHAEQWKAALYALGRESSWRLQESLVGGCPYVGVRRTEFNGRPEDKGSQDACLTWSQEVSDRILAEKPDMVFVSAFGAREILDDGSGRDQLSQYRDAFADRVGAWADAGVTVYVLRDTPLTLGRSGPECLALHRSSPLECSIPVEEALAVDPLAEAAAALDSPGVKVLDLQDQFCPGGRCYSAVGGVHVFFDANHITSTYMRSLTPVLAERLAASSG